MFKICLTLVLFSFSFNTFAADAACYASCNYQDQRSGSTFVGESKKGCSEACTDGETKCKARATGECKKIKCLSNCTTDQGRIAPTEMDALAQLEKLNPELQNQVAGKCTKFWDANLGKYEGVTCTSGLQGGVLGALAGLLIGSLGSASTMAACTVGGFVLGYLSEAD